MRSSSVSDDHDTSSMQPPSSKRQRLQLSTGVAVEITTCDNASSRNSSGAMGIADTNNTAMKDIQDNNETNPLACDDDEYCSSVESILGVPVEILFRQVGGEGIRRRPLLTRPEVEKFLRVTLLAQEIDVLVDLAGTVLNRQRFSQRFRRDVLLQGEYQKEKEKTPNTTTTTSTSTIRKKSPWKNPWLTTLGPILDVMEQNQPQPIHRRRQQQAVLVPIIERNHQNNNILHYIYDRMTQLCHELQYFCVSNLENSADQNRECFMHMIDCEKQENDDEDEDEGSSNRNKSSSSSSPVQILAHEKIALAELQDHLSKRIRSFLKIFCFLPRDNNDIVNDNGAGYIEEKDTPSSSSSSKKELFAATTAAKTSKKNNKESQFSSSSSSSSFSTVKRTGGGDNKSKSNIENEDDDKKDTHDGSGGNDEGDDDQSLLSLEEVMTPLKEFCEKLFAMKNKNKNVDDQAEKELTMGNKQQQQQQQQQHRKSKSDLSRNGSNESSSRSVTAGSATTDDFPAASQRTAGAAAVMLSLATKPNDNKHDTHNSYNNRNRNCEVTTSIHHRQIEEQKVDDGYENNNINNKNPRKYSASDDSSIDDPPEDGDDTNKGKAINNNNSRDNSKINNSQVNDDVGRRVPHLGIFDVVDVLTPQSQSQQEQDQHQEKRNERNKFNINSNTGNNNLRQHDYNEHNLSSLRTSESQTVAAEALTRMVQGNHTYL
jgi:hypothetical protein